MDVYMNKYLCVYTQICTYIDLSLPLSISLIYVAEVGERLYTMSSVKLAGFRSQLEASWMSSHIEGV